MCIYGGVMSLHIPLGRIQMWSCPQMSLWDSSFVRKQSHLDGSGRTTCSPAGSKLQRVPVDLLDIWATCLPVVALVSPLTYTHSIAVWRSVLSTTQCTQNTALLVDTAIHIAYLYMSHTVSPWGAVSDSGMLGFKAEAHFLSWKVVFVWNPEICCFKWHQEKC